MESKKTRVRTMNNEEPQNIVMSSSDEDYNKTRAEQIVFGWESVDKAAAEVYTGVHRSLLEGVPVFLYKNTSAKSDLIQVVVVRNFSLHGDGYTDFGVGVITAGYTMLYPHIQIDYLETDLISDLEKYKIDKKIIDTYKQIINRIKLEETNEE